MILNVGCGTKPRHKGKWFGDLRIDIQKANNVNVIMDAHHLGFRDRIFDEIHSYEVLEHLDSPIKALREFKRVLKEEGKISITVPNVWEWRRFIHNSTYKKDFVHSSRVAFTTTFLFGNCGFWIHCLHSNSLL